MNGDNQNITLDGLLKEIVKNRSEIKSYIDASETRILLKVEELQSKIVKLEKENCVLHQKLENLERVTKKNNILIFGLNKDDTNISAELIIQELNRLLSVNLNATDINNVYVIGKSDNKPIKIEFVSYLQKLQILKNCYKLKGTNISIAHDQTIKQRKENKVLRKHLLLAKQDGNKKCFIKNNKLFVNEEQYTAQQLEELDEPNIQETLKQNSAPSTPNRKPQQLHQKKPQNIQQETDSPVIEDTVFGNKILEHLKKSKTKKLSPTPTQLEKKTYDQIQLQSRYNYYLFVKLITTDYLFVYLYNNRCDILTNNVTLHFLLLTNVFYL